LRPAVSPLLGVELVVVFGVLDSLADVGVDVAKPVGDGSRFDCAESGEHAPALNTKLAIAARPEKTVRFVLIG